MKSITTAHARTPIMYFLPILHKANRKAGYSFSGQQRIDMATIENKIAAHISIIQDLLNKYGAEYIGLLREDLHLSDSDTNSD